MTLLYRNRDKVHTADCRYTVKGVATPWNWAEGKKRIDVLAAAQNGIQFCRTCKPLDLLPENDRPYAVCWNDGEPLVSTFEFPQYEFYCVVCQRMYPFLRPDSAKPTAALDRRHAELRAQYELECAARSQASDVAS